MKNKYIALLTMIIAIFVVIGGCGATKESAPTASTSTGTGGAGSIGGISITASPGSLNSYESSVITVGLVDGTGNTYTGNTTVNFSMDSVFKGTLSASSAQAMNGSASVTFTAGSASTVAIIYASVGGSSVGIPITITGGTPASLVVSAATSSLTAGNSTTITATITDGLGFPVYGATVVFSVDNALNGALSSSSVTSDVNGEASVTLTATAGPTVTVTASTLGISGSAIVNVSGSSSVGTLTLSSAASSVVTNGTMTITAQLRDASNYAIANATISFDLSNSTAGTLSSGGGASSASSVTAVTDVNGIASIALLASNIPSTAAVTASYTTLGLSASINIDVTAPPAASISTSATPSVITVRGTSTITALLYLDSGGTSSVLDGTQVTFTINDSTMGTLSNSNATTANGVATVNFTAADKSGTVTVSVSSGSLTKTVAIDIEAAGTGSIQFVSATPQVIGVKGSGQPETSSVMFLVTDTTGANVVDGTTVDFSMNGPGGGAYIGSTPGYSTSSSQTSGGYATVLLNSGSVAGPCTIIASTTLSNGSTISSSSGVISIGGGVPSATHFNLATNQFNLPGIVISGASTTISAYVADRFGNYNVLNGTSISFYAEAGAIDRQGTTDSQGYASVKIRTQAPNPSSVAVWALGDPFNETQNMLDLNGKYGAGGLPTIIPAGTHPRNGRVSVLATVQGEESFWDENGNGLLDDSYSTTNCPSGYTCECHDAADNYISSVTGGAACGAGLKRSEAFKDIGEPFLDVNDDGCRNDGLTNCSLTGTATSIDPYEFYVDTNNNKLYDGPNGVWDGPNCPTTSKCQTSKMIWTPITLVFSGNASNCYTSLASFTTSSSALTTVSFMAGDENMNQLEPNTTIAVKSTAGTSKLSGQTSVTVTDGVFNGPTKITFNATSTGCTVWPCYDSIEIIVTPPNAVGCDIYVDATYSNP